MTLGSDLLRFKKDQKFFLKDYETEGLNLAYSRPWQASFIVFTQNEILDSQDHFVWFDDLNVSPDAARITNFNYEKYKSLAKDPKEVLEKIEKYTLDEEYITVWNNGLRFDGMIYNVLRRACGLPKDYSFQDRSIDTIALTKAILYGYKVDRQDFLAWQFRLAALKQKSSLALIAGKLGVEFDPLRLHDAIYDCDINRQVFLKQLYKLEI